MEIIKHDSVHQFSLVKTIVLSVVFFFLLSASCKKTDPALVNATAKLNQTYGIYDRNKLDAYLPYNCDSNTNTVILIHGGGWVAGDKTNWAPDMINSIVSNGFAVVCINYRYACGDFHKQMEDINTAINYIEKHSVEWNIGSGKFGLVGGSAGGHLSLLYGHAFDSAHIVKAVISIVGPTDLSDTVFHQYANNYQIGHVLPQLLGADFQNNPQVYTDASPLFHCGNVPTLFIHGLLDDLVPPYQGQRMFDSLAVRGVACDTTFFGDAGHGVLGPNDKNKQQVYSEVNAWLKKYMH